MNDASHPGHDSTVPDAFRRGLESLLSKDVEGWLSMWAEDGVLEFPFAVPGAPARVEGKAAIREHVNASSSVAEMKGFTIDNVHPTANPNVFIFEFSVDGHAIPTDRSFVMRNLSVITLRDGKIINCREYWNPIVGITALGGMEALAAALSHKQS